MSNHFLNIKILRVAVLGTITILGGTFLYKLHANYVASPIAIGQIISFGKNQSEHLTYLGRGWSTPENWGVWMDGKSAKITLPLPDKTPNTLTLTLQSFNTPKKPSQNAQILINGKNSGMITVGPSVYTFTHILLPSEILKSRFLMIEILPEYPSKPKDEGLGNDERLLSIGLISAQYD